MLDGKWTVLLARSHETARFWHRTADPPPSGRLRRWRTVGRICLAPMGFDRTHSVEDELIPIEVVGLDLDSDLLAGIHD